MMIDGNLYWFIINSVNKSWVITIFCFSFREFEVVKIQNFYFPFFFSWRSYINEEMFTYYETNEEQH